MRCIFAVFGFVAFCVFPAWGSAAVVGLRGVSGKCGREVVIN